MSSSLDTLTKVFLREFNSLSQRLASSEETVIIDGKSLDLACIIAVSRLCYPRIFWVNLIHQAKGTVLMSNWTKQLRSVWSLALSG